MSIKIADRVKETSLTQGTGTLTLNGAFGGFQSFSSAIGDGNSTYYAIENESKWEVGIGTYTSSSNTLSRDTVLKSSSGTSKITISGVAIVFCSYPADKAVIRDENGNIPEDGLLTLTRDSAGNFIHMYKDDSYDRTISIYTDGNASPGWRMGVKNSPSSETEAPSEGYVYGKDGQVGLVGNSSNSITLSNTTDFTVKHNNASLIKASASAGINLNANGIHLNANSAAYPAITINGAAVQSQPLTEWTDSTGNVLSIVDKDGNIGVNRSSASYELDVTGSGRFTSVIFADATEQSTAYTNQEVAVSGWAEAYVDSQDHSAAAVSGWADSTMTTRDTAISGWARSYVDDQDHSGGGGGGSAADILANSASGVAISGIANTNVSNIASNLVEIRANSASGVVISGIANTNSASISTNVTNIASNLVEIRANSASGVAISGWAEAYVDSQDHSAAAVSGWADSTMDTRDAAVSGWAEAYVDSQDHSAAAVSGWADSTMDTRDAAVSGWAEAYVDSQDHSAAAVSGWADATFITTDNDTTYTAGSGLELHGTTFQAAISGANLLATNTPTDDYVPSYDAATGKLTWVANAGGGGATYTAGSGLVLDGDNKFHSTFASGNYLLGEIRDNSSSGVVISGIANANVSNIASNLVEIRANSASGVVISGIANTNVSNIATNVTDIATNAADIIVVSGIANTNVSNIASNLVEIRANSASGVVISGIAETAYGWGDHSLQSYSTSDTTYTPGSGLELHGTEFQAAISGANLLATNTPSDNQLASYDAATGKFTWVSAGASYTLPEASASAKGGIELFSDTDQSVAATAVSATASRTYGLQLNSDGQGVVNVPWVDTNTTYSEATTLAEGLMSTAHHDKLDGIEASATADQTQADINALEITKVGTVATGVWQGTAIADGYIASAATWNAKQAALTFGIANTNAVKIDAADVADDEYARFTANGLESRTIGEIKTDLLLAKGDVGLGNVENTALSTWTGANTIATVGTIAGGTWQGTAIGSSYIADAFLKNDADDTTTGTVTAGGFSTAGSVTSNGYKMSSGGYTDIVGTSHTLAAADNGKVLLFTNASAITLTVPAGLTSGHSCTVIQVSGGQITFDNNSGATTITNRQSQFKTAGQHARVGLVQYQPDKYNLGGDTAS